MVKLPAISVIVPVYHVEKELKRCLDSLLRQTFSDYEIILVNDGGNETEIKNCIVNWLRQMIFRDKGETAKEVFCVLLQ